MIYPKVDELHGWRIRHYPNNPESGKWVATRHGVSLNHLNYQGLATMILQKAQESRKARHPAGGW